MIVPAHNATAFTHRQMRAPVAKSPARPIQHNHTPIPLITGPTKGTGAMTTPLTATHMPSMPRSERSVGERGKFGTPVRRCPPSDLTSRFYFVQLYFQFCNFGHKIRKSHSVYNAKIVDRDLHHFMGRYQMTS